MADISKTVEIIFGAVDNTGQVISGIGKGVQDLASNIEGAIAPLNSLADTVKLADTAIIGLGLALGGVAIQKAGEFGAQIREVGSLFGATNDNLGELSSGVLQYAQNSTASIKDLNGAIYSAVSAGVDWQKSIEFINEAEKLSVAGKADLNSTVLALTGTMNAYGAKTDEASRYSDLFMKTVQLGQTTLPELASSLSQVTSTAAAAQIPFEEITAAVAGLTASGVPTSESMTAIKAAIANIINPSKEAADNAKALGISFDANALASKGFSGVLKEVYDATGGNITQLSGLFGSLEGLKAVTALGADNAGIYAKALGQMKDAAGTTQTAFDLLANTFDNVNSRFKNALDVLLITLGDNLQGEYAEVVNRLGDVFKSVTFSLNAGAFDSVFATLSGISKEIADFLAGIAKNLPAALQQVDFSKFNDSLRTLFDSLSGLFDGIDLSTPEGLADAIQLVVDSIGNLLNMGAGIADVWGELLDEMLPLIRAFADMDAETAKTSGTVLGIGDVLNAVLPAFGALGGALESVGLLMNTLAAKHAVELLLKLDALALKIPGAGLAATVLGTALGTTGLVAAAGAAGYALGTVLNDGIDWVVQKLTGSDSLGGLIYDLVNDTEEVAEVAPKAASGLKDMGNAAKEAAVGAGETRDAFKETARNSEDVAKMSRLMESALLDNAKAAGYAKTQSEFLAAAQKAIKDPTEANVDALNEAARALDYTAQMAGKTADASKLIRAEYEKLYPPVKETSRELKTSSDVMAELAGKANLTNKELIELAKVTKDAEVKLEQIASNERIKLIESKVKLDIAEVEANAKVATAILNNLSETYKADVGLIGELAGQLTDGYSSADRFRIDLIEQANERVEALHEAQLELIDAQVEYMRAKSAALASGNPIMTINAEGLEPHLESIMWEVFRQIQVKMAQDGGDMIVGGISL